MSFNVMVLLGRFRGVKRVADICIFPFLFLQVYNVSGLYGESSALDSVDVKYCRNDDGQVN